MESTIIENYIYIQLIMLVELHIAMPWHQVCRNITRMLAPWRGDPIKVGSAPCFHGKCFCTRHLDTGDSTVVIADLEVWSHAWPPEFTEVTLYDTEVDPLPYALAAGISILGVLIIIQWLKYRGYSRLKPVEEKEDKT